MMSSIALQKLVTLPFNTILDIGCGSGIHSDVFKSKGKDVTSIDIGTGYQGAIQADYNKHSFDRKFDAIWISHVLEHQTNVGSFLKKVYHDLEWGGYLCITVPPMKHAIVGGHLTVWNAGLLVYNLVLAEFNCSEVMIKQYDYNISIILRKVGFILPALNYDNGDIETLARFFPPGMRTQGFNGNITSLNWD